MISSCFDSIYQRVWMSDFGQRVYCWDVRSLQMLALIENSFVEFSFYHFYSYFSNRYGRLSSLGDFIVGIDNTNIRLFHRQSLEFVASM